MGREFEFIAGSLSLNLIDTISGRFKDNVDLLQSNNDLEKWLKLANFDAIFKLDEKFLNTIKVIREVAFRVITSSMNEKHPDHEDIKSLNRWAMNREFRPQYLDGEIIMRSNNPVESFYAMIASDALLLLKPESMSRIRRCPECKMLFIDNSRAKKRRWCSSTSGCGNRAKVRRHRENKKEEK